MKNNDRYNLIKQLCEFKNKKQTNPVSFLEFARALSKKERNETIGVENAPNINWRKEEYDPIGEEIKSRIFG